MIYWRYLCDSYTKLNGILEINFDAIIFHINRSYEYIFFCLYMSMLKKEYQFIYLLWYACCLNFKHDRERSYTAGGRFV